MTAQIWKENNLLYEFELKILPYNLMVTKKKTKKIDFIIDEKGIRAWLMARALHFKWKGALPGEERPEAYLFINAALSNFNLNDGYRVSFPNEDYISLYPVDITYRHIHKLKK